MTSEPWAKILATMGWDPRPLGRAGYIPVFDGAEWRVFRNSLTIYPGVENCADPAKVDGLRENVVNLLERYPETVPQLAKVGARVRPLLARQIKTYEDVVAWADSIFNLGPSSKQPQEVHETMNLAYDDFIVEVRGGRNPVYVIPTGPRGSGANATVNLLTKERYGPRHAFTKIAFQKQTPKKMPKPPRYRGKTVEGEPRRPRGRPRLDGLTPGSPEARRADLKKKRQREARRAARLAPAPARRIRLSRKADRQKAS